MLFRSNGYGFPAWRGGPMHTADVMGLPWIADSLNRLYQEEGPFWKPSRLLADLARGGGRLADWNRLD